VRAVAPKKEKLTKLLAAEPKYQTQPNLLLNIMLLFLVQLSPETLAFFRI
jgi:hypothetical protein